MKHDLKELRDKTVEAVGNAAILADFLGISPSAISQWNWIPHEKALMINKEFNIPLHNMRPDIWEES